jgi:hypothetical protein
MAAKFLVKKIQSSDVALPVFIPIALTKETIQSIPWKKITGREYFKWSIISQLPNWSNKSRETHGKSCKRFRSAALQ